DDDPWRMATGTSALATAVHLGTPIGDDAAVIVAEGRVGRLDLRTGRGAVVGELPDSSLECAPLRLGAAVLLACAGEDRAMVLDAAASLRVEWSFEGLADLARFVGDDDAGLGFVGPCNGGARRSVTVDAVTSASVANQSNQRSAVFCARMSGQRWVEHRLD